MKVSYWTVDEDGGSQIVATMPGHYLETVTQETVLKAAKEMTGQEWARAVFETNGYVSRGVSKPKFQSLASFSAAKAGGLK